MRASCSAVLGSRRSCAREDGLSMIEVIVALVIIGGVMAAASLFFINGLRSTGGQSQRQVAVSLANEALSKAQAVQPNQLITGRTKSDVTAALAAPGAPTVVALDQTSSGNYDTTAVSGDPQALPIYTYPKVNGITYTVTTFVDVCWLKGSATAGSCTATQAAGLTKMFRVSVDVSWAATAGQGCASLAAGRCDYVASTLIDSSKDPVFTDTSCTVGVTGVGITGISPKNVVTNSTQNITLTGTGFTDGAAVSIAANGGVAGNVISTSATQLVFSLAAGKTAGSYLVTVLDPNGCAGTAIVQEDAPPTITRATANSCGTSTTVTITGTGFQNNATLSASGGATVGGFTVTSATSATAQISGSVGTYGLTLINPSDGGTASSSVMLTSCVPPPSITNASATASCTSYRGHGQCKTWQTVVAVTGANLGAVVSVTVDGTTQTVTSRSGSSATATFSGDLTGSWHNLYVSAASATSNTITVRL